MLPENLQLVPVNFTDNESFVASLVASGFTDSEISLKLHISHSYATKLVNRMISKYDCRNRSHLVAVFISSCYCSSALT